MKYKIYLPGNSFSLSCFYGCFHNTTVMSHESHAGSYTFYIFFIITLHLSFKCTILDGILAYIAVEYSINVDVSHCLILYRSNEACFLFTTSNKELLLEARQGGSGLEIQDGASPREGWMGCHGQPMVGLACGLKWYNTAYNMRRSWTLELSKDCSYLALTCSQLIETYNTGHAILMFRFLHIPVK